MARALAEKGYKISYQVVSELLHEAGYSLRSNVKKLEGGIHWPLIDEDLSIDGLLGVEHKPIWQEKIKTLS